MQLFFFEVIKVYYVTKPEFPSKLVYIGAEGAFRKV